MNYELLKTIWKLEAFVDFFYKGKVSPEVVKSNLSSFLKLADFYHLESLKEGVESVALNGLNLENVVEMSSLANLYNAGTLKKATKFFIVENKTILGKQDFSRVPQTVMTELFKLLSQPQL